MPSYTGSGTILINGCTRYKLYLYEVYKWNVGDTAFLAYKASDEGKLEKVVIKKIRLVGNNSTVGEIRFIYQDTLNSLYNEWDLVNEYTALNLAKQYYERQMFLTMSAIRPCSNW